MTKHCNTRLPALSVATAFALALATQSPAQDAMETPPVEPQEREIAPTLSLKGGSQADVEVAQTVVNALAAQGYQTQEIARTWLGRIRVVAENTRSEARETRELIVSSSTGAIMRDRLISVNGKGAVDAQTQARQNSSQDQANAQDGGQASNDGDNIDAGVNLSGSVNAGTDRGSNNSGDSTSSNSSGGSVGGSVGVSVGVGGL